MTLAFCVTGGEVDNLNEFLSSVGVNCMGHFNAFGLSLKKKDLPSIIKKCNELMPLSSLQTIHQVDWEIPASQFINRHFDLSIFEINSKISCACFSENLI